VDVMNHDRDVVTREADILFEVIGALRVGQNLCGESVLGQVTAGAAVGHDDLSRVERGGAHQQAGECKGAEKRGS